MEHRIHRICRNLVRAIVTIEALFVFSTTCAQSLDRDREYGITLFEEKNYQKASEVLQHAVRIQKDDLTAWRYLGLVLEELGQTNDARAAHRKAATFGSSLVFKELKKGGGWMSRLISERSRLIQAAASAEGYIRLSKLSGSELDEWAERAASLRELAEFVNRSNDLSWKVYLGKEVSTKAHVLDVPPPESGLGVDAQPTVTLFGIFTANGEVRSVFPLEAESYRGFGLACIKAARKIRFVPAVKDGKPVSMYMEFQYSSNR